MRFQYKILLFILMQLLVVFAALTVFTLQVGKKTIRDEARLVVSDDLVSFGQAAVAYRRNARTRELNEALKKLMKDPQIIYFVLQDENNKVLFFQSKRSGMDLFVKRSEPPANQLKILQVGGSAQVNFYDFQNQRITEMWQGLLSNKKMLGCVRLGIDEKAVNKTLQHFSRSALNQLVYIDLAVVILAFVITFFFVRRLSQPLDIFQTKINRTLARFGHSAPPEIGSGMTMSLNEIADRFESAMQEIVEVQNERMDWVSTLSHEFRSPLQAIKGYAEYIRNGHTGPITPKTEHILSLIVSGSAHFEDFINQILDLVRLETGKLNLELAPIHVGSVLEESSHFYQMEAPKHELSLTVDIEEGLPPVIGDASSVHRIVTNLLSNAYKFTPPGGAITLKAASRKGGVMVCVSDTGVGISPKAVGRVFEKFFQSPSDYRTPGHAKGLGIGLAVCKMLVESQKGRIWVESDPGVGTKIFFTLDSEVSA